jgi:hypothetical protein
MLLWEARMSSTTARTVLAIVLATISASPSAKIAPLGVVTQAKEALLSNGELSPGTSIFDGDQLSTGPKGAVSLRSGSAEIFLAADTAIRLRGPIEGSEAPSVGLGSGTLVFSTAHVSDMAVEAESARIHAAASKPTVGQVRVLGPRTLQVYARRGALIFSYGEENERIGEGEAYRVVLLPMGEGDDAGNKPGESDRGPAPSRKRRGFLFFLVAGVATGVLWHHMADMESPDRP